MDWNKFIIMYKYEEYVRMENSEEYRARERDGLKAFVKGPRVERPSIVIFSQGISCVIIYQCFCLYGSLFFMYTLN